MSLKRLSIPVLLAATLLTVAAVSPANATESSLVTASPQAIADLVNRTAPDRLQIIQGQWTGSGAWQTESGAVIPADPTLPIQVPADGSDSAMQVTLPRDLDLGAGRETSDGTVVYESSDRTSGAAVQAMADGSVRAVSVMYGPDAANEFVYAIGNGFQPFEAPDGSIWVAGFNDAGEYRVFSVGDAWARDLNGNVVPTHYEVRGSELVQIVTPDEKTAFPVVADPTWQWYSAAYGGGFSKQETRELNNVGSVAGFCGLLGSWAPGFALACAVAGAQWWLQAGLAVNANGCVFISVVPAPIAMRWVSPECK